MKRVVAIILSLIMLVALAAGCGKTDDKTLIVGMELAYPPFETKDDKGNPSGVSVDFANALGAYLGEKVEIQNMAWDGLIPSLQTGKIDVIISSMTITVKRKEQISFSKPYAQALLALLTNANSNISSIDDLNQAGKTVVVKTGTTGDLYAQANLKNAEIRSLADESACVTEVVQGKADAFIYDELTIYRNQKANPDTMKAVFIANQDSEFWGVGVKKENTELLDKVNSFIDKFYAEKGFDPITQKYLADEKSVFDQLGFPWFFDIKQK